MRSKNQSMRNTLISQFFQIILWFKKVSGICSLHIHNRTRLPVEGGGAVYPSDAWSIRVYSNLMWRSTVPSQTAADDGNVAVVLVAGSEPRTYLLMKGPISINATLYRRRRFSPYCLRFRFFYGGGWSPIPPSRIPKSSSNWGPLRDG